MNDKELINQIKSLRKIEPNNDWVVSVKTSILGEVPGSKRTWGNIAPQFIFRYNKLIFAAFAVIGLVAGAFTFAQNSLPGSPLYVLKQITENSKLALANDDELLKLQLELANQKLIQLNKIAQANQTGKLVPAIEEFQANISRAAKDLAKAENPDIQQVISETKKIQANKDKIESMGIAVGNNTDLDSVFVQMIQREINDLQVTALTDTQKEMFNQAVEDFKAGNYSDSLEKILLLSNPQ